VKEAGYDSPLDPDLLSQPPAAETADDLEAALAHGSFNSRELGGFLDIGLGALGEEAAAELFPPPKEDEDDKSEAQSKAESHERASLQAGLMQMVVTMKNMALYPESNQTHYESVASLHRWLSGFLKLNSPLVLEVGEDHLIGPDGSIVYQERPANKILAAPLFRDGIQAIIFDDGLSEAELRAFLNILLKFRGQTGSSEDVLIGRLWEASFAYIRYTIATEYEQYAADSDFAAPKLAKLSSEYKDTSPEAKEDEEEGEEEPAPPVNNQAPDAKPIASLFALAESSYLQNAAKPPRERKKSEAAGQGPAQEGPGPGPEVDKIEGDKIYVKGGFAPFSGKEGLAASGGRRAPGLAPGIAPGIGTGISSRPGSGSPRPGTGSLTGTQGLGGRGGLGSLTGTKGLGSGGGLGDLGSLTSLSSLSGTPGLGSGGGLGGLGSLSGTQGLGSGLDGFGPFSETEDLGGFGPFSGNEGLGAGGLGEGGSNGKDREGGEVWDFAGDEEDELDFDSDFLADAFNELASEDEWSGLEDLSPIMKLTLEALKNRPEANGPDLEERLRQWGLNPKEIRQIGALLNWDDGRDISLDAIEIFTALVSSPALRPDQLGLAMNFIFNEMKLSLRKLRLKHLNHFISEFGKRAQKGEGFDAEVAERLIKAISSPELLVHLVEPPPTPEKLEPSYDDLRWLLYQIPSDGIGNLASILDKAAPCRKLWSLIVEVISYEVVRSRGRSINILTQLSDRALAKLLEIIKSSIRALPPHLIQTLARHKSGAVREATARALLEFDPENFHSYCAYMVLDPDPKVAALARPALAVKRNPAVEGHLHNFLLDSYIRNRVDNVPRLLDNYRLYGCTASPRAITFLEGILLKRDFKSLISRAVDPHKLGAALALFMMPNVDSAKDVLSKAGRSSFRNVRQAYFEAERLARIPVR
jgi:hypothetical protein